MFGRNTGKGKQRLEGDFWKERKKETKKNECKNDMPCYSRNSVRKPGETQSPWRWEYPLGVCVPHSHTEVKLCYPAFTAFTQFTLAAMDIVQLDAGVAECAQALSAVLLRASEAGMAKWPSLGKYYHLTANTGCELYPKEASLYAGKTGILNEQLGEIPSALHVE